MTLRVQQADSAARTARSGCSPTWAVGPTRTLAAPLPADARFIPLVRHPPGLKRPRRLRPGWHAQPAIAGQPPRFAHHRTDTADAQAVAACHRAAGLKCRPLRSKWRGGVNSMPETACQNLAVPGPARRGAASLGCLRARTGAQTGKRRRTTPGSQLSACASARRADGRAMGPARLLEGARSRRVARAANGSVST